jgi:hypothetical protein
MKLFDFWRDYDFGEDIYFTIGQFNNFNILDAEIHSSEGWSWKPDIRLTFEILSGTLFTIRFSAWSFSFSMSLVPYRYQFNLSHTRE